MDARLKSMIDGSGFSGKEKEQDVVFVVPMADSDRTQLVNVLKTPDSAGEHEDFDILSPIAKASVVTGPIAIKLLQLNAQKKVGSFLIGGDMLYYKIDCPASATPRQFGISVVIAAKEADDMERLLTKGGDIY